MGTVRSVQNRAKKKPGRFGTDIAAGEVTLTAWTATATVTQVISTPFPPTAADAYTLEGFSVNMHTAGSDGDGAITLKVQKVRGGSGGTVIDLTDTFSLEAGNISVTPKTYEIPMLSTLTTQQLAIIQGDSLIISKVNDSAAIDTQPVGTIRTEYAVGA